MLTNKKNIALTGMMGCGKSTISKELSTLLPEFDCVEMDYEIEKKEKTTINEIFSSKGEKYFREIETKLIKELSRKTKLIISMGGGAFLREENRELLKQNSISFYLKTNADEIYNRIKNDTTRPLLKTQDIKAKINEILKNREKYYNLADITIDTTNKKPKEIAQEVLEKYNKYDN